MFTFSSAELNTLVASLLWPLSRVLGLIATAPLFGNVSVPIQAKIGLGVMLTFILLPLVPSIPAIDPLSLKGLLILVQQIIIGLGMGFAMRIAFSAVEMTGEIISMTMGLSFATFFDPQSQGQSTAISQFLALLITMAFLSINGHLVMLSILSDSFFTLPIAAAPLGGNIFHQIVDWGGKIFSAGVQLSLPVVAALLITNIALGILTRSAPQLNLFGIGFPITLSVGFSVLALALPYFVVPVERLFQDSFETMKTLSQIYEKIPSKSP